ncbi:MAG: ion channel [Mycobacteriaceae bacterium]
MTTVTTVGYGDRYPVTGAGRAVAADLMLVAIAVIASSPQASRPGSSSTARSPSRRARRRRRSR